MASSTAMNSAEVHLDVETPLLVADRKKEFVPKFFIETIRRLIKPKFITRNIQIILDLLEHYSAEINANNACRQLRACIIQVKNLIEFMISERDAIYLRPRYEKIFAGTPHYNVGIAEIKEESSAAASPPDDESTLSDGEIAQLQRIYREEVQKKRAFASMPRYSAGEVVECKSAIVNNKWCIAVIQAIFRYDNKIYYFVKYGNRNDMLDHIAAASKRIRAFKSCKWHSIVHSNRRHSTTYGDTAGILKNTLVVPKLAPEIGSDSTSSSDDE